MSLILLINEKDNVANALADLSPGQVVQVGAHRITVLSHVSMGHKLAIQDIPRGGRIYKYGQVIGLATQDISKGEHVHIHNIKDPVSDWKVQYIHGSRE